MKILAIAADLDPSDQGGAERLFLNLLNEVAPKVERVTVIVGGSDSIKKLFLGHRNISFLEVKYPKIPNLFGLLYILWATPKAVSFAWANKVDLIWAKQEYPQAQVGAIVRFFTGVPLHISSPNPVLHTEELVFKGVMPRFIKKPLASIVGLLINWAFKQSTVVAAMSQYSAQQAKRAGAKNVVVVPGGVDVSNVINLKPVKKPQKLKLITTSTLIPRNGIDVLVEACTLLPADIDWELKIAGDGPMREKIENSIRSKGLNKRVKIIGMVQSNRVVDLLDQSYLFARPSRAEGFGVSFIEAMSRGVPIIGTLVGGIPDFLKHKKTGVSVPVDDPQALADAIILLWKSKKLYDRIRKNAWLLVKNRYNWTRIGKEFYHSFQMTVAPND